LEKILGYLYRHYKFIFFGVLMFSLDNQVLDDLYQQAQRSLSLGKHLNIHSSQKERYQKFSDSNHTTLQLKG
tara:strand:- start:253 stop:468 length:216 start_codon:yes stop_codon:yes gene_type:complete